MGSRDAVLFPLCPPGTHGKGVGGELGQKNRQRPKRRRKHLMSLTLPLMEIQNCLLLPPWRERGILVFFLLLAAKWGRGLPPPSPRIRNGRGRRKGGKTHGCPGPTTWLYIYLLYIIIIYMLCCWGLPASAPLSVSSRLVSHKHTQTHTTPQIHHPSYPFFFFFTA